ncbi:ATP-binding cassette domain-containing protein [Suttonella sp. R2A3]|uniref:ABC transporter ATP-binding protein n=1 Tax=Suttonella sp. R2A3 TaxID=2908648 RepID=UPI001F168E0C|nr:ATP-binding cassette domain-containing protein [Suttonella sp. R2A3]UJF24363.1 ATP-binding cassette domain-containing protein [Suttonella sp. R2A3]
MSEYILQAEGLNFAYEQLPILNDLSLQVRAGESLAIVGASGSGKSTLLHILAGLDIPQSGEVSVCGERINGASDRKRTQLRNRLMGFVYQFHHLLPEFSAHENVAMPLLIRGTRRKDALKAAEKLLDRVGLCERMTHLPSELSGGERQRTAIARALVNQPSCLLADEPTGNLDQDSATAAFALMQEIIAEQQGALIIVTHDLELAAKMDRCHHLVRGQLVDQD